jgi:predicted short-subunit dehydrogenase-like oxidoreductase (DUF2520 family)
MMNSSWSYWSIGISGHRTSARVFCYSRAVATMKKFGNGVTLVGTGNLAQAIGPALKDAGYTIDAVVGRSAIQSRKRAEALALELRSTSVTLEEFQPASDIVWLCHTDDALGDTAQRLARRGNWKGKLVLHSSGALTSEILAPLRRAGAWTASLHPMMTFVPGGAGIDISKVPFAVEGGREGIAATKEIIRRLKAQVFEIRKEAKVLYHALGSFSSPMIVATLVTAERVGKAAGLTQKEVRKLMTPILLQTTVNYLQRGPGLAFSGPIKRGDLNTVRRHLQDLARVPGASDVYRALVKSALIDLPAERKRELRQLVEENWVSG